MLENNESPDKICQHFKFCTDPTCLLYPNHKTSGRKYFSKSAAQSGTEPWWKKILDILMEPFVKMAKDHLPLIDPDHDGFADTFSMRGSAWRGKDCDNTNSQIYPGRRVGNDGDATSDHNCNGIYGVEPQTQKTYEELFCSGTFRRGVAVLGDSGSAHFRVPQQLVMKGGINKKNYQHILGLIQNEADWPQLSTVTGHMNDTTGLTPGPVDSIYLRMRQRNRCVHRDYQNIGVNGASSDNVRRYMHSFRRNQTHDEPVLLFLSLIGNDVCGRRKSYDSFTTLTEFHDNIIDVLNYLDTVLPPKSFVTFVGLAQGSMLYDYLWNQTHPLGTTYSGLYNYMNCLDMSPCWGWMNTNRTIREATSKRAEELSTVYDKIMLEKKGQYRNFDMAYHKFPLEEMAQQYIKSGGNPVDLIEPFDGFHPSQLSNSLVAKGLFEWLEKEHPEALGPINPYNAQIDKIFGDQGGY